MAIFGRLFGEFGKASKGLGSRWSQAINEAGSGAKKVGKFIKPIAQGVQLATGLLQSPLGQVALYGLGSLGGPAGLALASSINLASKGLYTATSIGLGLDNIYGGLKSVGEGNYLSGGARTALGLAGAMRGVSSLGKIRVEGLRESGKALALKQSFTDKPLGTRLIEPVKKLINPSSRYPPTAFNTLRPYDMGRYYDRQPITRLGMLKEGGRALGRNLGRNVKERFGAIGQRAKMVASSIGGAEAPDLILQGAEAVEDLGERDLITGPYSIY